MFRWLAPLVLLAGKPEVLLRILIAGIAAAVLFFGVWLASNIAITFDQLKNPYIAAIYGVVLLCFFIGVGIVAWLRLRQQRDDLDEVERRLITDALSSVNGVVAHAARRLGTSRTGLLSRIQTLGIGRLARTRAAGDA